MLSAAGLMGKAIDTAPKYKDLLAAAGFVNITVTHFKWPQNAWPREKKFKDMGIWCKENILQGLDGFTLAFHTRALGWTKEEVEAFLVDVRKEINDKNIHAYWPM